MSISLTLVLTPHPKPASHFDPKLHTTLSFADGWMPVAWWCLFAPEDVHADGDGSTFLTSTSAALQRLRRHAPLLRALAGRHALGLRALEHTLTATPDVYLQVLASDLYYNVPPSQLRPTLHAAQHGEPALWREIVLDTGLSFKDGRILSGHHGGTLADAVTGHVCPKLSLDLPTLDAVLTRSAEALADPHPPADLDLWEESLAQSITPALTPFAPFIQQSWVDHRRPELHAAAQQAVADFCDGRPDPFAPLNAFHPQAAAHALSRLPLPRAALRRVLPRATDPWAAVLARSAGITCPIHDQLLLCEWLHGAPAPRDVSTPEALLACRLAALRSPLLPLSSHDPLALAERIIWHNRVITLEKHAIAPAIKRALTLTEAQASAWLAQAPDGPLDPLDPSAFATALASSSLAVALLLTPPERVALLLTLPPTPDRPALHGAPRAAVLQALGHPSDAATTWLHERLASQSLQATCLLLETPLPHDHPAIFAALALVDTLPTYLPTLALAYAEGLCTSAEVDFDLIPARAILRALQQRGLHTQAATLEATLRGIHEL